MCSRVKDLYCVVVQFGAQVDSHGSVAPLASFRYTWSSVTV
jgi:hypothetical protein